MMVPLPRWQIPPLRTAAEVFRRQGGLYRSRERLKISAWAQLHRDYDPEILPWQAEIMDALGDSSVSEVGLLGPSQAGKSDIGLAWIGWIIDTDPSDTLICQPDRSMSENFVKTRLDPMIERTAAVRSKLQPVANANNIWLKLFRGMSLASIWPVPAQFAQRPIRFGWIDDYDQIDDDIGATGGEGGQGSAISLLEGRFTSHEGREKKFISSSPADERGGKTEAFVAAGTDERMQPACPHCGERFEIDILRDLRFDHTGTADQAEASAHVICPANGCVLEPQDRRRLLASLSILPNRGFVPANPAVSQRRRTFRIDGLMALTSWPKLARLWREAELEWETRQDESLLRTFVNTKGGKNYRSQMSGDKPLDSEGLKARREQGLFLGRVPAGVKVWVITIDVQHNRLECMAYGWGDGLEGWIIDRWSIDVLDDGLTSPAPFTHPEHSSILLPLFSKRYPLADGSGLSPPPLTVQIDVGGGGIKGEGATGFVRAFWEAAIALGIHRSRITLTKGGSRPTADLMPRAKFADQKRRGGAKRNSAELWMPNVHRIKGMIDARLRRSDFGPGFIHLPGGKTGGGVLRPNVPEGSTGRLLDEHIDEITAEEMQKGKWTKIRPRNETLDLLVAAQAAILRPPYAQSRTHMRWVPAAFAVPEQSQPVMPNEPVVDRPAVADQARRSGQSTVTSDAGQSRTKSKFAARKGASWMKRRS